MISVKHISTTDEFSAIRKEWNELLAESRSDTIFLTWEWAFSWWEEFCDANTSLFILRVTAQDKIIAIAPLVITKRIFMGFINIKEINFLGAKTVHGESLDFIIASDWDKNEVMNSIVDYLDNHKSQWDIMRLTHIPETSGNIRCMTDIARGKKYRIRQEFTGICPFIVLPDSKPAFHASINKSLLKNFKYQKRRLQKQFGATFELYNPQHLDSEVAAFFSLHENRWKSNGLPGAFTDQRKRRFYQSIGYRFSEKNWLGLWFLKIDTKPIAALWGFQYKKKFYYLQSGFDPEWSKYSIGKILLGSVIENAILDACSEFDFLMGAEPYKYEWGATDKKNIKLDISCPSPKTTIFYAISYLKNSLWK